MNEKWNRRFLTMASVISNWSKDPSTKVGAVIANDQKQIISHGYNGFPRGAADDLRLYDRRLKLPRVLHAEENAVLNAAGNLHGCTVYITHPPCLHCCSILKQVGIKEVVCPEPDQEFKDRWDLEGIADYLNELEIGFKMT